jgi:prephenate dehydratase
MEHQVVVGMKRHIEEMEVVSASSTTDGAEQLEEGVKKARIEETASADH